MLQVLQPFVAVAVASFVAAGKTRSRFTLSGTKQEVFAASVILNNRIAMVASYIPPNYLTLFLLASLNILSVGNNC